MPVRCLPQYTRLENQIYSSMIPKETLLKTEKAELRHLVCESEKI